MQGKVNCVEVFADRKMKTIKKLDETILENTKQKQLEKEIEDSGEFCQHVYSILTKIDFRLEHSEHSKHGMA